jgi:hypothetical protein
MTSCTASAAWNRPVLSLCCTKHCPYHGVILSGRITSVGMFMSGQLGRRYTVVTCKSCMCFGNTRACLINTRA